MAEQVATFIISIKIGYRTFHYKVQHFNITKTHEDFRVLARNKTIVLRSNRPFFRNRGIRHRQPTWELIEGKIDFKSNVQVITDAIMDFIELK